MAPTTMTNKANSDLVCLFQTWTLFHLLHLPMLVGTRIPTYSATSSSPTMTLYSKQQTYTWIPFHPANCYDRQDTQYLGIIGAIICDMNEVMGLVRF
ncbi:predicted protein [Lichtheimia corymbifera JMRC:FSU:9682]|uniref:Uncharacterized protein n=1 Tax=Lichtheimia corymbifera JMRC:FSU:9682 TaxID=1263082 RepID=A0A068SDG4_9FUNG|nr:predicted protein [Lichtheimia corymbifera JMRC:FSU:9682]